MKILQIYPAYGEFPQLNLMSTSFLSDMSTRANQRLVVRSFFLQRVSTSGRWRSTNGRRRKQGVRRGISVGLLILPLRNEARSVKSPNIVPARKELQHHLSQGKTVEVGRAYFETSPRRYTVLDAPGHKTYVLSMISGAAQADVAILVISARKGEFETGFGRGGQTREHIMLVKTAGVSKLVIVINKMDDPTVLWAQERFKEIKDKLAPFVRSAGFHLQNDIQWIPISGYTGVNVKDRVTKKVAPWWT